MSIFLEKISMQQTKYPNLQKTKSQPITHKSIQCSNLKNYPLFNYEFSEMGIDFSWWFHHFNSISNQPTKAILTVTIKLSSECGFCTRAADSEWWVQFWNRKTVPFWRGVLKRQRNREGRHFFSVNLFLLCGHFSQLSIHGDSTSVWRGVTRRTAY